MGLEGTARDAVQSQYLAALAMLRRAIEGCAGELAERLGAEADVEVGWVGQERP
jgi:hypothetical protein